jgi:hypothetical protein
MTTATPCDGGRKRRTPVASVTRARFRPAAPSEVTSISGAASTAASLSFVLPSIRRPDGDHLDGDRDDEHVVLADLAELLDHDLSSQAALALRSA